MQERWDSVALEGQPSWYLDPLVARQKRRLYQALIGEWTRDHAPGTVLKTDLFEEAYGEDHVLFDLFPGTYTPLGLDISLATVRRTGERWPAARSRLLAADVRCLPLRPGTVDLIISTSTLDHFDSRGEFQEAIAELARVLRPGGLLVVAMDNPLNLLYLPLRWLSKRRASPFPLGYTTTQAGLARSLEQLGLDVLVRGSLIHNPRIVSTLLFLGLRRLLRGRADGPIALALKFFDLFGRLPTRQLTACFIAVCARKPHQQAQVSSR
jgi:SAM-dependent methyltransferase